MNLVDAIYSVVRAKRNKSRVSDLAQIAVDTYQDLVFLGDVKPDLAHKIVDWYLA